METKLLYPIRYVARQTGLREHLIRTWESRYEAVKPLRSASNRRLYRENDITRLRILGTLVDNGHSISQVAGLTSEELVELERVCSSDGSRSNSLVVFDRVGPERYCGAALKAVIRLDTVELEAALNEAAINLTKPQLLYDVICVLKSKIDVLLRREQIRQVNVNVANTVIRAFLWDLLRTVAIADTAPKLVVATLSGHHDEIDALILAITAAESGWRSKYIGPNLTAVDIASAVSHFGALTVVVRLLEKVKAVDADGDVYTLRRKLPKTVKLVVCNDTIVPQCGDSNGEVIFVPRLEQFRQILETLPTGRVN